MKKVYWSGGKRDNGMGGLYSLIDDETCIELEKMKVFRSEGNYYICTDSNSFKTIAKAAIEKDEESLSMERSSASDDGGLYSNPGKTLKGIAKAIFIIGCIVFTAVGIIVANLGWDFNFLLFVGIFVVGVLLSYIGGLGLAALGDLAINANEINRKLK